MPPYVKAARFSLITSFFISSAIYAIAITLSITNSKQNVSDMHITHISLSHFNVQNKELDSQKQKPPKKHLNKSIPTPYEQTSSVSKSYTQEPNIQTKSSQQSETNPYMKYVYEVIAKHYKKSMKWQNISKSGEVGLTFHIDIQGNIGRVFVHKSSGEADIDTLTMNILKGIKSLKAPDDTLTMSITLVYGKKPK